MAASVVVRQMEDGPRNTVLWIEGNNGATGLSPGTGGLDLPYAQILLPAQVGFVNQATGQRPTGFTLEKIEWDIQTEAQMRVDLFWDATVPSIAYSMIGRANKTFKFFGGMYSPTGLAGATGGLGMSTSGAPGGYAAWTIILELKKLLKPA